MSCRFIKILLIALMFSSSAYATLAGGRPNAFSEGQNAFAGVVNPANAVWIKDRFDIGGFWIYQKTTIDNRDDNPLFLPGKQDYSYRVRNLVTPDAAIHKQTPLKIGSHSYEASFGLAYYTTPTHLKVRTKKAVPANGTTPIFIRNRVEALSFIFSLKLNKNHSIGLSIDCFHFSHLRNGFQRADNFRRSVSPGHVTNNGTDYSNGLGLTIGWRWKITESLNFGIAWVKKSYCGQYRKYRGYEPHHAKNYVPQTLGGGFSYRFSQRWAGRLEVLWSNFGNLPSSNNNVLPNGQLNLNKRGSSKSPGPGQQDATFINMGLGYAINPAVAVGASLSHRIKLRRSSNFISHIYTLQTIYNILAFGTNINYEKHNLFIGLSFGFKNRITGYLPNALRGGKFTSEKSNTTLSASWGYLY